MTAVPDPKSFYNETMPRKTGGDYEHARWRTNRILAAQYGMMTDLLHRLVEPKIQQATSILEVGPGPGTWTELLLAANDQASYTLVDISREMLAQAQEKLGGRTNVSLIESDLISFEASQQYEYFFSSRAIEYMSDKRKVCEKISHLLAPGASGAIITKMPKPIFDRLRGRSVSSLHGAQIAPQALVRLLAGTGLVVEGVHIATATMPLIGSASLNELVYWSLKRLSLFFPLSLFAESYIVTFRKPI